MKLEIISGQPNVDTKEKFLKILSENGISYEKDKKNFLYLPELEEVQPKLLYDFVREKTKESIETNNDLFILTYSDHVLNGVRVEIKNHKFENGKCHQYLKNGEDICATISNDGRLDIWVEDIFDVWDKALTELL